MWVRAVAACLIASVALLLGCGEDAEVVFPDDPAYVTESQIAFVSYRIVS